MLVRVSDEAVPANQASDPMAPLRVLVVEDDEGARQSHVRAFGEHNIQMISVTSVDAALAERRASPAVDVVLTDVHLGPDEDDRSGVKLAEFIRSTRSDLPIVAYSAHFDTANLQQDREMFDLLRAVVGRLGGDEFLLVCRDLDLPQQALAIAARVRAALNQPATLAAGTVELRASIGVARATPGMTPDTLVANADTAMYESKRRGEGQPVLHDDVADVATTASDADRQFRAA